MIPREYALRFPTEADSFAVAVALGAVTQSEDGPRLVRYTHAYAIDVLGTLTRPTGAVVTDANGYTIPEMETLAGWHVNIRLLDDAPLPAACIPFVITPDHPARTWL